VGAQTARQVSAPTWVAVQWRHRQDAIGSEGAKILTQFAPGGEHPGAIHEGELHRPDDTLGAPTLFIVISDVEPRLAADCGAQLSEQSAIVWKGRCRSRGAQRVHDLRLGLGRQHCGNLRRRDGRCRLQDVVAALIDVAQAKQDCLDLSSDNISGGRKRPARRMDPLPNRNRTYPKDLIERPPRREILRRSLPCAK
jgi:hypothetical protein